ncbi:LysR family transcriptional regulator [Paraburkholderia dipogonis]|uniref:LysR family transcriptional regulator n=1 Tax=Paraburkholderia dipogonis TaxID=1211383 RepID=UPI0035E8504B
MDQLYMLRAFVAAARYQSFSKGCRIAERDHASVSKAIAKLEGCIQTRVLLRTTRSVSLTEAAQTLLSELLPFCSKNSTKRIAALRARVKSTVESCG